MNYSKKRWSILIAACFINLCIGSMYAWSVFAAPMAEHLSAINHIKLTPADLAVVFIVGNSVGPITMITGGKINDVFGPKLVILIGGLMFGGGMFLSGFATSVNQLVIDYGLILGLGLGMVYGSTISTSIKFFPDKRGLVGGLTTALFGISSVVIPPIAAAITAHMGVVASFKIIGAAFTIIVCGSAFFIDKCPEDFIPDGWTPNKAGKAAAANDKDWKQMLMTPTFYMMFCLLMCGAIAGLMCISLAAPLAQKMIGMSTVAATGAVSTLALFNVFGRIAAGSLSDKIGRVNTLAIGCFLTILGLYCLYLADVGDTVIFYLGISIIGICFGAFMGVFPGLTADQFGAKNNSVNFGILFAGFAVSGFTGSTIMHRVLETTHSYKGAFLIGIGFCLGGLVLSGLFKWYTARANKLALAHNY
ncbi:L-lactate MFS transporter [Vibrio eleionomae]|nr:OFA family MFS transporter [Vibrio eleionomae]